MLQAPLSLSTFCLAASLGETWGTTRFQTFPFSTDGKLSTEEGGFPFSLSAAVTGTGSCLLFVHFDCSRLRSHCDPPPIPINPQMSLKQ